MARRPIRLAFLITLGTCATVSAIPASVIAQAAREPRPADQTTVRELGAMLEVGDVVFIRVSAPPFKEVASATESWTNHVGIVIDVSRREPVLAESRFPFSGTTTLSRFIARSQGGRVAVTRLDVPLTARQQRDVQNAARKRAGVLYDTGFDLHSQRQFCSRFVREVLDEATGIKVGEVEKLSTLFARHPSADLGFWRVWYVGNIPWQRDTVTPASLLHSAHMHTIFDGLAGAAASESHPQGIRKNS